MTSRVVGDVNVWISAMLRRLNETTNAQGMNLPGWGLHPLKGRELKGHFSVWVSGNWRMTFTFEGTDAVLVDYQDYHQEIQEWHACSTPRILA